VIAALLGLLLLAGRPPPSAPQPPAPKVTARPSAPPPRRAPPIPRPAAAAVPSPRDALLAAIRERSAELAVCETPPGSPSRAVTRLRISRAGVTEAVSFEVARPLAPTLAACLRGKVLAWRFEDVPLPSDVDLLVTFVLAAGPG
jgi:hypothetical protein